MSDISLVKEIRLETGASVKDINAALAESNDGKQKALEYLEKQGKKIAAKKSERSASEGIVTAYIHGTGKVGVLLELACETDFVARNADFKALAHDLAMHIAALNPSYVSAADIPADVVANKRAVIADSKDVKGKPAKVQEKIIDGKFQAFAAEIVLLQQPFVKDGDKIVQQVIEEATAKIGEKIQVKRFARFAM